MSEARRALALACAIVAAGCSHGSDDPADDRVVLAIELDDSTPRPQYLTITWYADDGVVASDRRLPAKGELPPTGPLTVELDVDGGRTGDRRVDVRGFRDGAIVCQATTSVPIGAGARPRSVKLGAGRLPDRDGDGVPDPIDDCPDVANPDQKRCDDHRGGGAGGSSGSGGQGGASAPDPAAGPDGGVADGGSGGAAGAEGHKARGKKCSRSDECETGLCVGGATDRYCASIGMVVVPGGPFSRGCDPSHDPACAANERPGHTVVVSGFEVDVTEVTQAAYALCVTAGKCSAPAKLWDPVARAKQPVTGVTWEMASSYCAWAGKRLPTEAEWEKAARGDTGRPLYPWGDDPPTCLKAQYAACGLADVVPVAALSDSSPYGARDLAGNASEWVSDFFGSYADADVADPQGPKTGTDHVRRGGSFESPAGDLRVTARASGGGKTPAAVGFRCARSL